MSFVMGNKPKITFYSNQTIEEYSTSLESIDMDVCQLSKGFFNASTHTFSLDDITLTRRITRAKYLVQGRSLDYIVFVFPLNNPNFFSSGHTFTDCRQCVSAPNKEFYAFIPQYHDQILVSIKPEALQKYLSEEQVNNFLRIVDECCNLEFTREYRLIACDFIYNSFTRLMCNQKNNFSNFSTHHFCKSLLQFLYEYLDFHKNSRTLKLKSKEKTLLRALNYIHDHTTSKINLENFAENVFASRRTIQYAFSDIINLSPKEYINKIKMNAIRKELLKSQPSQSTIASILDKHGISNYGRFSREYFNMFGEFPKKTLESGNKRETSRASTA